jgi:formate hydrogenlyase subunit 3/multisubunit Na+/H+ antiporter MnhD subunit
MGLLMVVTAGLWAAFQTHLGRMLGYFIAAETGFMLIALGLENTIGVQIIFLQIIPRGLGMIVWALSLSLLSTQVETPRFSFVQGALRAMPFAAVALVTASLAATGFPLLAEFPPRLLLMEAMASLSFGQTLVLLLGLLGLLTGAIRTLAVMVMAPAGIGWERRETPVQAVALFVGIAALFLLGWFPQITQPLLKTLPSLFQHLGQGL